MAFNPERVAVPEKVEKVSAQRMRLWHALHEFCRDQAAHVVSVPGHRELRIEIPKESSLPTKLTELGYAPVHRGTCTRIEAGKFMAVDVISILLPGK